MPPVLIPVEPGTTLISFEIPHKPGHPIIAWSIEPGQVRGWPVLPFYRKFALLTGEAFLFPNGTVVDPKLGQTFSTKNDWFTHIATNEPYKIGLPSGIYGEDESKPVSTITRTAIPVASGSLPTNCTWTSKVFKGKSFWHFDGDPGFVFTVEAGQPTPAHQSVNKITREVFNDLRKTIGEKTVNPDDEPDLPLESDEPEDDAMDMV